MVFFKLIQAKFDFWKWKGQAPPSSKSGGA